MSVPSHSFSDGNQNRYSLVGNVLTFKPVTPIESSSGFYSGGEPWSRELSEGERTSLIALFEEVVDDEANTQAFRVMGTGQVWVPGRNAVLKAGAAQKRVTAFLKNLAPK